MRFRPSSTVISAAAIGAAVAALAAPAGAVAADKPGKSPVPTSKSAARHAFSYSDLERAISRHAITLAKVDETDQLIRLTLAGGGKRTVSYPIEDPSLIRRLAASGAQVEIDTKHSAGAGSFIVRVLPIVLMPLLLLAVFAALAIRQRKHMRGMPGMPAMRLKKNAKVTAVPNVRFADVAGCDEAVEEMREVLEFLKDPQRYFALGATMPKGTLLYGPPGTGKTLMAKALAGEAGLPFFSVSGSDFVEKFVGVGSSRIRELFTEARAAARQFGGAIIFFDELDAIGRRRSGAEQGGNEEREQTLNALLVEMDGFDMQENLHVVAATNRLDVLDPALIRPGRLSRQIQVDNPTEDGRLAILEVHTRSKPLDPTVDLAKWARLTGGLSGAQLAEIANEAAIMAARNGRPLITGDDLNEAWLRVLAGPEKIGGRLSDTERTAIAYHEAGHVLTAEMCETHDKAERVTIRRRGRALGLAAYGSTDKALHDMQYMHEELTCLLGGRAAEQLLHGRPSSGAANDLMKANGIARRAVEEFGLSPRVGQIISGSAEGGKHEISEKTRAIIDQEVEQMVADAYRHALNILQANRPVLDRLAQKLIDHEDLDRVDIVHALGEGTSEHERVVPAMGPMHTPVLAPARVGVVTAPQTDEGNYRYRYRRRPLLERLIGGRAGIAVFRGR